MSIKLGTKNIVGAKLGSHNICKIYKGSALYMDFCGGEQPEIEDGCILYSTNGDSTYRINNTAPSINAPSNVKDYVDCSTKGRSITTLRNMFNVSTDTGKQNFTKIDLSHLDLSTITDKIYTIQQTFTKNYFLKEVLINLPEKLINDTIDNYVSGYASMQYTFAYCPVEKITSNLAFYELLYNFCPIMGISNDNLDKVIYTITDGKKDDILYKPYTGNSNYIILTQKVSGTESVKYNNSSHSISRQSDYDNTYHRLGVEPTNFTSLEGFLQGNSNVTEFNGMRMNMSNCTSLVNAFYTSTLKRIKVTNWDVSNVDDFSGCFWDSTMEEIDLRGWKPKKTAKVSKMFAVIDGVKRILIPDFPAFDDMETIFSGIWTEGVEYIKCSCDFYEKVRESKTHCGLNNRFDNIEWDYECYAPYSIIYSTNSTSNSNNFTVNEKSPNKYKPVSNATDNLLTFDDTDVTNLNNFADNIVNLTKVKFVGEWDTPNLISVGHMFSNSENLVTIDGIEKIDFSNVVNMNYMFYNCKNLRNIDLSKLNVNKNETIGVRFMFYQCNIDFLDFTAFNGATLGAESNFITESHIKKIRCYQPFKDWCYEQYNKNRYFFTYIDEVEWDIVS